MYILGSLFVVALLAFGAWVAVMNWVFAIVTIQNQHRGIDRYASPIPLVAQLTAGVAAALASNLSIHWVPDAVFWCIALVDISIWTLAFLPVNYGWRGVRRMLGRVT